MLLHKPEPAAPRPHGGESESEGRLRVDGLTAGYGQTRIIEAISFEVAPGSRLAVLGRNGVGKTTLLASLAGLTTRHGGAIALDGTALETQPANRRALAGLGYVPQTRAIFPSLTVEENLIAGLKRRPRAALDEAFGLFPRLAERRNNGGRQLSGGEQQMLSVARALLGAPRALLLDEPLEGLAPVICDQLMAALERLPITMILVEQQIDRALLFADTAIILDRGHIVHMAPAAALARDEAMIQRHLGVALPTISSSSAGLAP